MIDEARTSQRPVIACFTPGTRVATLKGEILVEKLAAGDKVVTRDNGIQDIRWAGSKKIDWRIMTAYPHLKPVLVRQGSLGNDLPERDLMISPNHRILVANERTALHFDRHEVVLSDGIWTESFQPTDTSLKGFGNSQRAEIFEIFPDLETAGGRASFGAARKTLTKKEAAVLVE